MCTARAIIIENNRILLIHRIKDNREYYVLPGGHQKEKETIEKTLIREIKEETNLDIKKNKILWKNNESQEHIYLITKFTGNEELNGPEKKRNNENNRYILEWHKLSNLKEINIKPNYLKKKIINYTKPKIFCLGNIDVKEDSYALTEIPGYECIQCQSVNEFERNSENEKKIVILDVVKNLKEIRLIKLNELKNKSILTMHDFDISLYIQLQLKLGNIKEVKIIGIPQKKLTKLDIEKIKKMLQ